MKKSIKRLPKRTQEELTVLLDLVCKNIENCQMVILFGSYARGNYVLWDTNIEFGVHTSYQSDYDILLVVTGQTKYVERKLNRITNKYHDLFADRRHAFPQFVVEHINTVNRNLEISQYFFTDIVKEGIMLYNSGKCELAKPRKLSFREMRDIAQSEFDIVLNMGPFYHLITEEQREKCMKECLRVLRKGGFLVTAYIPRYYVFQYIATSNEKYLDEHLAKQLIETGVLKHDDEKCFWTDTYYSSKEEMESIYQRYRLKIVDHFAQDGLAPLLSQKVDKWDENQFKTWCDYHYSVCREQSVLGASNHVIIIGRK